MSDVGQHANRLTNRGKTLRLKRAICEARFWKMGDHFVSSPFTFEGAEIANSFASVRTNKTLSATAGDA